MPCRYVIDKTRRLVISTGWDCLTYAEMKAHQDQLLSDANLDPEFNQLMDATAVTSLELSAEEMQMLAKRRVFSPKSRRAWVASQPAVYGMGRLASVHHNSANAPTEFVAFYDMASALEWLGRKTENQPA